MPGWFGPPKDVNRDDLEAQRKKVNEELRGFDSYEAESHFTPMWICPCGRANACAETTCDQCGDNRPPILHGDPDQGDEVLGLARMIARGQLKSASQIPQLYFDLAENWRSHQDRGIDDYRFDTRAGKSWKTVGWRAYVDFLLRGGRV